MAVIVLEKLGNLNHEEGEFGKVTYHHIQHLNWCVGHLPLLATNVNDHALLLIVYKIEPLRMTIGD